MIKPDHIQTIRDIIFHYQQDDARLRAIKFLRGFVGVESQQAAKQAFEDILNVQPWTHPEIEADRSDRAGAACHVRLPTDRDQRNSKFRWLSS